MGSTGEGIDGATQSRSHGATTLPKMLSLLKTAVCVHGIRTPPIWNRKVRASPSTFPWTTSENMSRPAYGPKGAGAPE